MARVAPRWTNGEPPEEALAFIEWLCTPPNYRDPAREIDLADKWGMSPTTFARWKKKPQFQELWKRRAAEVGYTDELKRLLVEKLWHTAMSDNKDSVAAAKTWLAASGEIQNPHSPLVRPPAPKDMTDAEVDAALAEMENDT